MITAVDTNVLLDVFLADPQFGKKSQQALREALDRLGIAFSPLKLLAAERAGDAWRTYRARGGSRLLTRDSGYFRTYFPALLLLDPSST